MLETLAKSTLSELPLRKPVKVAIDTRLGDVVTAMRNARHGAALVVKRVLDRDELLGVFTERDLIHRIDHGSLAWRHTAVGEVMTERPRVVKLEDSVAEALRRMAAGRFRHLPVVRGREPVAICSIRDLLAYLAARFPGDFINLPPDPGKEAHERWGG